MSQATYDKRHSRSVQATAALARWRFATLAGTHARPSDTVAGVTEGGAVAGRLVSLITGFSALVESAGVIAVGDRVGPAADGSGRAATGGGAGIALGAAAAEGELVEVELQLGLTGREMNALRAMMDDRPGRTVGYENEQPADIARPVKKLGKLACTFGTGLWTATVGAPTLTQGYTGLDANGVRTGIVSRTSQQEMLRVVPAANTTERITLGSVATNMLTRGLAGKLILWVYVEAQPGYQVGGSVTGSISVELSTSGSMANGLVVSWNTNQVREGWNALKFVMRNPAAYQASSGVAEYHPLGVGSAGYGTGADTNIVASDVTTIRIEWVNMLGATLYFDSVFTDFECQPQVVLGHDGGINVLQIAAPIFDQYGWVGYTALPYRVWSSGSTVIPDLNSNVSPTGLALYARGWDWINHTANHLSNGTLTSAAAIAYELVVSRAWQLALDAPRGMEFYASPQSSSSRLSEKVIKDLGFKLQRHARRWNTVITPFGIDNPGFVGAIDMGSSGSSSVNVCTGGVNSALTGWQVYSKLVRALDVIEAYGDTLFAFWHGITTSGDTGTGEDATGDSLLLTASAFTLWCAELRARELAGRINVCRGLTGFWYGSNA